MNQYHSALTAVLSSDGCTMCRLPLAHAHGVPVRGHSGSGSGRGTQPLPSALQEVEHVRSVFPETWLWVNASVRWLRAWSSIRCSRHAHNVTLPPARNESHCYTFTFWLQPLSPKGGAIIIMFRFRIFNGISFPSLFYIIKIHLLHTHTHKKSV